jgi:NADPH2:quinone reductase
MRSWQVHGLGEPAEVMSLDEVPDPEPAPGLVRRTAGKVVIRP